MESGITTLNSKYIQYLISIIRNKKSGKKLLRNAIFELGVEIGKEIFGKFCTDDIEIMTPMSQNFSGLTFNGMLSTIISTRSDALFFSKGCKSVIINSNSGFMDFGDARGEAVYTSPLRAASLPEVPKNSAILNLIILKSVLATGCTAISLTRRSIEFYSPKNLIIGTIFYSESGLRDLKVEFPNAHIILCVAPDHLDTDGMLVPGIGNLDQRI